MVRAAAAIPEVHLSGDYGASPLLLPGAANTLRFLKTTTRDRNMTKGYGLVLAGIMAMTFSVGGFAADAAKSTAKDAERQADTTYKADKKKADADYKAAKERCDELKGNEKDACQKEAKAAYEKAKHDAKGTHKKSELNAEAAKDRAQTAKDK